MAKKPQEECKKGAPAYMNTYGDMMTLLMTFFVLMFSMAEVDAAKFEAFITSFQGSTGILDGGEILISPGAVIGNGAQNVPNPPVPINNPAAQAEKELQAIKGSLEEFIETEELGDRVGVEKQGDAIIVRFADILLFDSGNATLKTEAKEVLEAVGLELQSYIQQGYRVKLEGHTDNIPIKTLQFPSNWELSASRAIAVATFFIEGVGLEPSTVSAEGYGEYMPIGDNQTADGRAMNRRVELRLTKAE